MAKSSGKAGSLFYGMSLDTTEFKKRLKDARKDLKKAGKAMRETLKGVAAAGGILAGSLTAVAVGLSKMTINSGEAAATQTILAKSIGATTQELDGLIMAAQSLGVGQTELIDKMREFGGIDEFKKIADQVKNAGSELEQMALAQEILGNEGLRFLPILQLGADGLRAYTEEAIKSGNALPASKISQLTLAWEEYQGVLFSISGTQKKFSAEFAKPLAEFLNGLKLIFSSMSDQIIPSFREWTGMLSESMPKILKGIFSIASGFSSWFQLTMQGITSITEGLFGMGNQGKESRGILQSLGDTIATIPETAMITIKRIGAGLTSIFQLVGNSILRAVMAPLKLIIETLDDILKKFGSSGLNKEAMADLDKFKLNLVDVFEDLTKEGGLFDTSTLEKEKDNIIKDRIAEEKKFEKDLSDSQSALADRLKKLIDSLSPKKTGDAIAKMFSGSNAVMSEDLASRFGIKFGSAIESALKISQERAGMAVTGSQEEFRARTKKEDMKADIDKRNVKANETTARSFSNMGIA